MSPLSGFTQLKRLSQHGALCEMPMTYAALIVEFLQRLTLEDLFLDLYPMLEARSLKRLDGLISLRLSRVWELLRVSGVL